MRRGRAYGRALACLMGAWIAGCATFIADNYKIVPSSGDGGTGSDASPDGPLGDANADGGNDGSDDGMPGGDGGGDGAIDGPIDGNPPDVVTACTGVDCGLGRSCDQGVCKPAWVETTMPGAAFPPRIQAASCAIGSRMFVWGGATGTPPTKNAADGAIYDPSHDQWSVIAMAGAPSARVLATAVWTGSVVVVWGGGDGGSNVHGDGAVYDPMSNKWSMMQQSGAPTARRSAHGAYLNGMVVLVGGVDHAGNVPSDVGLYDPKTDSWATGPTGTPPSLTSNPTVGTTATDFFFFGGTDATPADTNSFDDLTLTPPVRWSAPTGTATPSARHGAFGGHDGTHFVVWGGALGTSYLGDGAALIGSSWTPLPSGPSSNAPTARAVEDGHTGWSATVKTGVTLMIGGRAIGFLKDGALYDSTTSTFSPVDPWPGGLDHEWAATAWTGTEFIVWGGLSGGVPISEGARFRPPL
jgi:hypothetical protein